MRGIETEREHPSLNEDSTKKLLCVTLAGLERSALDPVLLDVSRVTSFADAVLLLSGRSDRQVRAIAESIVEALRDAGEPALGIEGLDEGRWVLIDCNDVIVHVFEPDVREEYDLERLWSDAPEIDPLALGVPAEAVEQARSGRAAAEPRERYR